MVILKICAEVRVDGTHTSVIFSKYGVPIQRGEVFDIVFQVQSAVIDGLVASKGNAPIQRLAFIFWSGYLYTKIQPIMGRQMTWLMLAQASKGILQFMGEFEYMTLDILVLDDEAGPVATGMLRYYRPGVQA